MNLVRWPEAPRRTQSNTRHWEGLRIELEYSLFVCLFVCLFFGLKLSVETRAHLWIGADLIAVEPGDAGGGRRRAADAGAVALFAHLAPKK